MSEPADLLADVAPRALGDGRYELVLGPAWSFALPSGGVLTSIALAAMQRELGDDAYRPISTTAIFASAVKEGPVAVEVAILRRGKAACQLRAAVRNPGGDAGLEVTATFARTLDGPRFDGVSFPAGAPSPAAAAVADGVHARWPFFCQMDVRLAIGPAIWDRDFTPGEPRYGRWFRYRVPPRGSGGAIDRLAVPPLVDTMPAAIIAHLGPNGRMYAPSLDLTVHFLADTTDEWLLVESFARAVWDGYASCDAHLWSASGQLVAYATQTMILKPLPPR